MAKNFVQKGENLTLHVSNDVKSGDIIQVGDLVGIALTDAIADSDSTYITTMALNGVWEIKVTGLSEGDVAKVSPKGGSGPVNVGFAIEPSGDTTTNVLICQGLNLPAA